MADSMYGLRRSGQAMADEYRQQASGVAGLNRRAPTLNYGADPFQNLRADMNRAAGERGLRGRRMEEIRANYQAVNDAQQLDYQRQRDAENNIRQWAEMGLQKENNAALRALTARGQDMNYSANQSRLGLDREKMGEDRRQFAVTNDRVGEQFRQQEQRLLEQGGDRTLGRMAPDVDAIARNLMSMDRATPIDDPNEAYAAARIIQQQFLGRQQQPSQPQQASSGAAQSSRGLQPLSAVQPTQYMTRNDIAALRGQSANQPGGLRAQIQTAPQDDQALAWAKANPNDPRARQILAALGM